RHGAVAAARGAARRAGSGAAGLRPAPTSLRTAVGIILGPGGFGKAESMSAALGVATAFVRKSQWDERSKSHSQQSQLLLPGRRALGRGACAAVGWLFGRRR